jgi:hypothetical protein
MKKPGPTLLDIVKELKLHVLCGSENLDRKVGGGYVSDLLSDVMANGRAADIWITAQCHPNIVAVAILKEICGILIVSGRSPEHETVKKAKAENLPLMTTKLPAFEISGRLYGMGIRSEQK